jgi:hypothetical protein
MMKKLATALLAVSAGCATTTESNDGAFHIQGRVDAKHVSHVIATNPETGDRVVAVLDGDRVFSLALEPDLQWVVTFADWTRVGRDMQIATLQANGLDAFRSSEPTTVDFGTIKFRNDRAYGSIEYGDLLMSLGLDHEEATRLGRIDNLALRYANPDIDGDGSIDALQFGHDYRLDIAGTFQLTNNHRAVTVADLVGTTWANRGLDYTATTIQAAVPRAMNMNMASGTLKFDAPFFGTALGEATQMVAAGMPVGAPHVKVGELDGTPMIGVVATGDKDAPRGSYRFAFANGALTFSDVHAPTTATLSGGLDYAVPFIRIEPTDATCKVDCDIARLDIAWQRMVADAWTPTSGHDVRIEMAISLNGKPTYLAADLDASTSSLAWRDMPVWNTGITQHELTYVQTSEICYLALTYTSELGMKMTTRATNPACY